ncbi:Rrf2 family transcriptional regulator [Engelhardtia mirabilis]|uniref:Uncharacterized protein n=1 Tax=Engelhardtia mirabilis TaxID=2528011 RepID=A0A518BE83_9BACT|nr:hypothetical protein Pla133_03400 [Planctomycetes bacterium Pla133]QDU99602.1 hypothetical protein Pla86_03400 [Planctomycetes bacterium Pla86]
MRRATHVGGPRADARHESGGSASRARQAQSRGLIETRSGAGGGSVLARPPGKIRLREAYDAVNGQEGLLARHPASTCDGIAEIVGEYVNELSDEAERALLARLDGVTVAEMDRVVRRRILNRRRGASVRGNAAPGGRSKSKKR